MNQRELVANFVSDKRDKFNPIFFERNEDDIIKERFK